MILHLLRVMSTTSTRTPLKLLRVTIIRTEDIEDINYTTVRHELRLFAFPSKFVLCFAFLPSGSIIADMFPAVVNCTHTHPYLFRAIFN